MQRIGRPLEILACVSLLMFSVSICLAQNVDYYIKVTNAVNLRSTYDLNSPVVEMVGPQTTLHVIYEGVNGYWLKIERNGNHVWMFRKVNYSRVANPQTEENNTSTSQSTEQDSQQSEQPAQQPEQNAEVNNMCQISWTCTTQEDWERGWYAYQNRDGQNQNSSNSEPTPETDNSTYLLPAGCYESYRYEGTYIFSLSITCKSSRKITEPVPLSFFTGDCRIRSRTSYYSRYYNEWTTYTNYSCE